MKKKIILAVLAVMAASGLMAQVPDGYRVVDSLVITPASVLDTALFGKSVFDVLPECVKLEQSYPIRKAVSDRVAENESSQFSGYRIRIYFDNGQNARYESESAMSRFKARHPAMSAYRTFTSPYFKVTVGDFRTRSDALSALRDIKLEFPAAFIVRDKFRYPSSGDINSVRIDTLHVIRRIQ